MYSIPSSSSSSWRCATVCWSQYVRIRASRVYGSESSPPPPPPPLNLQACLSLCLSARVALIKGHSSQMNLRQPCIHIIRTEIRCHLYSATHCALSANLNAETILVLELLACRGEIWKGKPRNHARKIVLAIREPPTWLQNNR